MGAGIARQSPSRDRSLPVPVHAYKLTLRSETWNSEFEWNALLASLWDAGSNEARKPIDD